MFDQAEGGADGLEFRGFAGGVVCGKKQTVFGWRYIRLD
jgi:hypothetical protein